MVIDIRAYTSQLPFDVEITDFILTLITEYSHTISLQDHIIGFTVKLISDAYFSGNRSI